MAGKSDITASAGLDLADFEKGINRMATATENLAARAKAAQDKIDNLGNSAKLGVGIAAAASFAKNLALVGRAGGEASSALEDLNTSGLSSGTLTRAEKIKGAFLDISGAISSIPILGKAWDFLSAPITATARFRKEIMGVDILLAKEAVSTDAITAKTVALQAERSKLAKTWTFWQDSTVKKNGALTNIETELVTLQQKHAAAAERQSLAQSATLSGSEKASKLAAIEQERQEAIAKATAAVKDAKFGGTTEQGASIVAKETEQANKLADARKLDAEIASENASDEAQAQIEISKTRMDGLDGAVVAAGKLRDLAYDEQQRAKEQSDEQYKTARAKYQDAAAGLAMAERAKDLAVIENALNKDLISARKQGVALEVKSADAQIKAAQSTQKKYGKDSIAGIQAKQQEESATVAKRDSENKYRLEQANLDIAEKVAAVREDSTVKEMAENKAREAMLNKELSNANVVGDARRKIQVELGQLQEKQWQTNLASIQRLGGIMESKIAAGQGIGAGEALRVAQANLEVGKMKLVSMRAGKAPAAEIAAQEAKIRQGALGVEQQQHQRALATEAAQIENQANIAKLTNTERVGALVANELKNKQAIAAALRDGNLALANELKTQTALNALQIKAADFLKTPKEKADELREKQKQQGAMRAVEKRDAQAEAFDAAEAKKLESDNAMRAAMGLPPLAPNKGRSRSGDTGSAATRKAIKDAADRAKLPANAAANQQALQQMIVTNLVVTQLKTK